MAQIPDEATVCAEWQAFADATGVVFLATRSESGPVAS